MNGPNILPRIVAYKGLDLQPILEVVSGAFDWNDWDDIEFRCPSLFAARKLSDGKVEVLSSTRARILLENALYASGTGATTYRYQVVVVSGSSAYPVPVGEGSFLLLDALS